MSKMHYYQMIADGGPKRQKDIMARPLVRVEDPYILNRCAIIDDWDNNMVFEYDPKEGDVITDYLGNVYGWDMFSEKAINLFGDLISNDVQLLPIKVVNKDTGLEIDKFFVLNVLTSLDALDLENSKCVYIGAELSVMVYAIKGDNVGSHHIFRLKDEPFSVFVSEKIYKIIKKHKMLGCELVKLHTSWVENG